MKRMVAFFALFLALALVGGCAQGSDIGAGQAKELALADAGLTAGEVEALSAERTSQNGKDCYQVVFTVGGQCHQYQIDAHGGAILDVKLGQASAGQPATEGGTALITPDEAKAKALAHAGLTDSQVTVKKNKLDREKGRQVYEVEFYTADGQEYEYEIDAVTGQVVSTDYEGGPAAPTAGSGAVTADQAKAMVLERVPGATAQDFREFETDQDYNRTVYEGELVYGGMEYEFEINAQTGALENWKEEPVHH